VLEGPQLGLCFYTAIDIRSVFEYDWAGTVYKSACNDTEQQIQLQAFSLLSDRVGMLRVPRSVAKSELHDIEQTLKNELLHIFEYLDVFS